MVFLENPKGNLEAWISMLYTEHLTDLLLAAFVCALVAFLYGAVKNRRKARIGWQIVGAAMVAAFVAGFPALVLEILKFN
jgi:hypothetical protein